VSQPRVMNKTVREFRRVAEAEGVRVVEVFRQRRHTVMRLEAGGRERLFSVQSSSCNVDFRAVEYLKTFCRRMKSG
jgi:hypothetical protein